ncbi:TPA: pyridoxal phosphate-dependent aminotransferase [Methanocaldococcus jannaschii]|uniref:Probable aspartate aminotransferase n=2 Tax=Methanocaldococcus jannaschii TaxID=2190 RepID=AAT_METJA|nr:pyridoxal phosphate-dependent aminotransferase [Methanocaldococcus jannaschii]Q60317.1 RecName: Full=Probable aspartate aminotransferase; Short=AspAT; AltName: Full=Transaminase A [Methanocaldococcus jannaschii DSM 2661]AAB97984.1 aspartate aminotransferase (aspB1) [Methanocaldococcus jannaschii DSM 2661]HII60074.1 pyridoxal phosphate-dependent aminotransferase [Methanocaldococcus jannaschii]
MISSRCKNIKPSAIREIFNLATSDCINLGIGEPDFDTPKHIIEAAKRALDEGKTHYSPNNGIPELREEISNKLKDDYNLDVDKDNIIVTCGASEALMLSIMTLIDRGDEVLIPNPSFVSYFSLTEFAEGKIKNIDLDENFNIDLEKVKESITKKTKLIIFNSPSNPTGKVYDKETIKGLAEIAEDYNLIIVSDEVYDKIIYDKKHYSPMQFTDRCILINGFSKTYAMTGWRIGYLAVSDELNKELDLINNMIKIHQYSFACATTFAQYGALAALRGSQKCVEDMVREFKMRRDLIYNGLKDIFKVNKPDGAFYIFPDVSEYGDGVEVAKKLIENKVLCVPGVAFGENGANYIRFSYATKYEDIEKALGIIKEIFE